ncbi:MAG TPA: peptidoglycan bridge formation glycyltransferase FemA/FemB family protein [Candidatus Limnocylindrales bacterium]|nr:peptidoglycan bridge formation glycyltransferase FemA/FemB family protein [Candidatus Limnocylindrales bacterium]
MQHHTSGAPALQALRGAVAVNPPRHDAVEQLERGAWDALVARRGGQALQSWAWGELKSRIGWQAVRLASGDARACAQVLIRRAPDVTLAYVPRGPLLSGDAAPDHALVDGLVRVARASGASFLRFEPDVLESDARAAGVRAILSGTGFTTAERTLQPRSTIRLDLTGDEEQLRAAFSKGHRADIRRAEREGVTIRVGTPADTGILHEILVATSARKAFGIRDAAYYRYLMEAFGDGARLQIAELEGDPVGASVVIAFGRHGMYLAAGSTDAGLRHRAAHLLQWHAIRWARQRGARTWDLWGIADARGRHELAAARRVAPERVLAQLETEAERDPLDGVFRFKKGWGGSVVRMLPAFDRVFDGAAYAAWRARSGGA